MNPNEAHSVSIAKLVSSLRTNHRLILQMAKRDIVGRYRGSVIGLAWSFFNPLLMLVVYTFVFSVVFKARWGAGADESKADFAIILFVGLIVHGMFAECINRAPSLILSNTSYVKKVVFPLEILPWMTLVSALFHAAISVLVLISAQLLLNHQLPWTALLFPLVLLPLLFTTVGFSYIFSALGVYVRDLGQVALMFTTVLFFMSPVIYPVSSLPNEFQGWMRLSPLTFIIEGGRESLMYGQLPDIKQWFLALVSGLLVAWLGFALFQKTRRGFADVL